MSVTLTSILARLGDQDAKLDAQYAQIKLIAAKSEQEQADLEQIDTLLQTIATKSDVNASKLATALAPAAAAAAAVVDTTDHLAA